MKLFLHLFTLFVYDAQIAQVHTGIAVKNLQDEACLHISKEITYTAFHKACQNLCILQTYRKYHFVGNNDTKWDRTVPVFVITFFDHRNIDQNQSVSILHLNTRPFFFIQRSPQIINFDLKLFRYFKYFCCCRICQGNPTAILRFLNFVNGTV